MEALADLRPRGRSYNSPRQTKGRCIPWTGFTGTSYRSELGRRFSLLSQKTHESLVYHLTHGNLSLEPAGFKLLFNGDSDSSFENPAVQRERIAVFVIPSGSLHGVELDILSQRFDAVVAIFPSVPHSTLIGAQEFCRLLFLLGQPRLAGNEADVGPIGVKIFQIEEFGESHRFRALGDREPQHGCIDHASGQCSKACRSGADLQQSHFFGTNAELAQARAGEKFRKRAEPADGEFFSFRIFEGLEGRSAVDLKVHQIRDSPEVLDVPAAGPRQDSLGHASRH